MPQPTTDRLPCSAGFAQTVQSSFVARLTFGGGVGTVLNTVTRSLKMGDNQTMQTSWGRLWNIWKIRSTRKETGMGIWESPISQFRLLRGKIQKHCSHCMHYQNYFIMSLCAAWLSRDSNTFSHCKLLV